MSFHFLDIPFKSNSCQKIFTTILVFFLVFIPIVSYILLKPHPTKATVNVVEVTAKTINGVYVDATQAVRDGISQLSSQGGGVLFFGPGPYWIKETIDIPSNITLEGVGAGELGPTWIILGDYGDMNATGMALFSVLPGAENVVFKDLELRSMTPGVGMYPRYDTTRIKDENTTAVRIYGNNTTTTQNITFQKVRISNFTYGIDAGSNDGSNPVINNVKIRGLSSNSNYWGLRTRSLNATNWDIQNFNMSEMFAEQNGVLIERSGNLSFLQLSCSSTNHNAAVCVDIGDRSGALYFNEAHVEGPANSYFVRTASNQPIFIGHSVFAGVVQAQSVIYSFANRYDTRVPATGLMNFTGTGVNSTLYTCRDVFQDGFANPTETYPSDLYPGLANVPSSCNFDVSSFSYVFPGTTLPYQSFDWIASGASPSADVMNVRDYGAVGDGITDDTTAFRNAIAAQGLPLWTGTIIIPDGTYKITDTIQMRDGLTLQGSGQAVINYTGTGPLFQIKAMQNDSLNKRGISLRGLWLYGNNSATAIDMSGNRGSAADFSFWDLYIFDFDKGIYVHNDSGQFDYDQPTFDSMSINNVEFNSVGTAIDFRDENASNWNLDNVRIQNMGAGQNGVKLVGGGHISIRNTTCQGVSNVTPAGYCVYFDRHGGLQIENLSATNTQYAVSSGWFSGLTPYPVVIKNSNLRDGVLITGKAYLLSVGNTYTDGGTGSPPGSHTTLFTTSGSGDPMDNFPGTQSRIASCHDIFRDQSGVIVGAPSFLGLINSPEFCSSNLVVLPPPTITSFTATPSSIIYGSSSTLSWSVSDAGTLSLDQGIGAVTGTSYSVIPTTTTTYTLTATNVYGSVTSTATITVMPNGTVATPTITPNGGSFTTSQAVTLATSTSGATIRYTTNGTTPTATVGTIYTGEFTLTDSATVKAIAYNAGMTDSAVSSADFTKNTSNSGGGGGGSGTTTPPNTNPQPPVTIPPTQPPITVPIPNPNTVILPTNVIAGQVIKFPNSPIVYLVQSTGLHPFDSLSSLLSYQAQSGAIIIIRQGTASTYTVSPILAKTVLNQSVEPTTPLTNLPLSTLPEPKSNIMCVGSKTVYFYYHGKKEAYPEASVFEAWNGKNYSKVILVNADVCSAIPNGGLNRLPDNTIVRTNSGKEIYRISNSKARPYANYNTYLQESANKITYVISVSYLHTYARGENIE